MRYWLSNGDGKTYGPYEIDQLRALAAEGRVPPGSNLCEEGGSAWMPAAQVLGAQPTAPSMVQGAVPPVVSGAPIPNPVNIAWPILVILCCCLPGGIVGLIYGVNANAKAKQGDAAGAARDAKNSHTWTIVSAALGLIGGIIYAVVMIAAESAQSSGSAY